MEKSIFIREARNDSGSRQHGDSDMRHKFFLAFVAAFAAFPVESAIAQVNQSDRNLRKQWLSDFRCCR
jgi:hypothetical protein